MKCTSRENWWNNNAVPTNNLYITLIFLAFFFTLWTLSGGAQFGTPRKWPGPARIISQLALLSYSPTSCNVLLLPPSSLAGHIQIIFCHFFEGKIRHVLTYLSPDWPSGWVWGVFVGTFWIRLLSCVFFSALASIQPVPPVEPPGKVVFWMLNSSDPCHTFWVLQRPP